MSSRVLALVEHPVAEAALAQEPSPPEPSPSPQS
jgi:hypothetical protein